MLMINAWKRQLPTLLLCHLLTTWVLLPPLFCVHRSTPLRPSPHLAVFLERSAWNTSSVGSFGKWTTPYWGYEDAYNYSALHGPSRRAFIRFSLFFKVYFSLLTFLHFSIFVVCFTWLCHFSRFFTFRFFQFCSFVIFLRFSRFFISVHLLLFFTFTFLHFFFTLYFTFLPTLGVMRLLQTFVWYDHHLLEMLPPIFCTRNIAIGLVYHL